jgi:hypothetical protein
MTRTTRAQRVALKRLYDRWEVPLMSYKRFRQGLSPTFGCNGAVVIDWCHMWICIEQDGYSHS